MYFEIHPWKSVIFVKVESATLVAKLELVPLLSRYTHKFSDTLNLKCMCYATLSNSTLFLFFPFKRVLVPRTCASILCNKYQLHNPYHCPSPLRLKRGSVQQKRLHK